MTIKVVAHIGQCEAYNVHEEWIITRCVRSGRSMPLADVEKCYVLCNDHANASDIILPEEKLR